MSKCFYCLNQSVQQLSKCSRCNAAWYCCVACQKKDWQQHKLVCHAPKGCLSLLLWPGITSVGLRATRDIVAGDIVYDYQPDVYVNNVKQGNPLLDDFFRKGDDCQLDNAPELCYSTRVTFCLIRKKETLALKCLNRQPITFANKHLTAEKSWYWFQQLCTHYSFIPDATRWNQETVAKLNHFVSAYMFEATAGLGGKAEYGLLFDVFAGYANHSCRSNCDFIILPNRIVFFAKQTISKGSEITISYQPHNPKFERNWFDVLGFECKCGHDDMHQQYRFVKPASIVNKLLSITPATLATFIEEAKTEPKDILFDCALYEYGQQVYRDSAVSLDSRLWILSTGIELFPTSFAHRWKLWYTFFSTGRIIESTQYAESMVCFLKKTYGVEISMILLKASVLMQFPVIDQHTIMMAEFLIKGFSIYFYINLNSSSPNSTQVNACTLAANDSRN